MAKILVTGGAGFIGSNLVDALIEEGHEVFVIDNLSTGLEENLNERAKFYKLDITSSKEINDIFKEIKPDSVFHLAAQASVITSTKEPVQDVKVNVIGTINLLDSSIENDVKKFIFSSTGGAIYGETAPRPTTEAAKEEPISPYGMDKLSAEKYVSYFAKISSMQTVCLRYANVYGPRQNPKGEAGVISIFTNLMLENQPVTINGNGEQTRDFVYVGDVVRANLSALSSSVSGTFNIGTGKETSVNELADLIKTITKSNSEIKHADAKQGELLNSSLDSEKAFLEIDFKPQSDLQAGLRETIKYFQNVAK